MRSSTLLLSLALALPVLSANFTCPAGTPPAVPPPPSQDPFYTPPAGFVSSPPAPGTILKSRSAPALSYMLNCEQASNSAAYQFLYSTRSSNGSAVVGVVSVVAPPAGVAANSSRLLVYQPPYDSPSVDCAPSYQWALQNATNDAEPEAEINIEEGIVQVALRRGWYVAISDYETTGAQFTTGVTEGRATLDAAVAALASGATSKVSSTADIAFLGYSGGALGSEWGAELQSAYQPSLTPRIKAIVAGGITANISNVVEQVNGGSVAALIPKGLVGLANGNSTFAAQLDSALRPDATLKSQFYSVGICGAEHNFTNENILTRYFTNGEAFLEQQTRSGIVASEGLMGRHGVPSQNVYFFNGCQDEIANVTFVDALVNEYCTGSDLSKVGSLTYQTVLGDHGEAALEGIGIAGTGPAFQYIVDRFNGVAIAPGCHINNTGC